MTRILVAATVIGLVAFFGGTTLGDQSGVSAVSDQEAQSLVGGACPKDVRSVRCHRTNDACPNTIVFTLVDSDDGTAKKIRLRPCGGIEGCVGHANIFPACFIPGDG